MKRIKVEKHTRPVEGVDTTFLTTSCPVRPGVMVGSCTCTNCWSFSAFDAGKGAAVLCGDDEQTLGAFVR